MKRGQSWDLCTRWGVTLCTPGDDAHVVEKLVCYNEKNARRQGVAWKKRHPDHVVRYGSLLPGDSSDWQEVR